MAKIVCPYCGEETDFDDCEFDKQDGGRNFVECPECQKTFMATTNVDIWYEPTKCDCMNGGHHEWTPTKTYPLYFTRMYCPVCGETRSMTTDERRRFNIPETLEL